MSQKSSYKCLECGVKSPVFCDDCGYPLYCYECGGDLEN